MNGWIGVDLDGTLAMYDGWAGHDHIGEPVGPMLERVKRWRAAGLEVRIFTARVDSGELQSDEMMRQAVAARASIEAWCLKHIGEILPITNRKDFGMIELWDDRAVQVDPNTGQRADGKDDLIEFI